MRQLGAYLEKWTMKQLLPSPDDGVLVLVLPLQSLGQPLHKGGQCTACETLKEKGLSINNICHIKSEHNAFHVFLNRS